MSVMTNRLTAVMAAIADQLQTELGPVIDGVQIVARQVVNPTPPTIDIYGAAEGFLERISFRKDWQALYVVRATVLTADQDSGQDLLMDLLDPAGPLSVIAALEVDTTFGGVVNDSAVTTVSGPLPYTFDPAGGSLLGAEWRLQCLL